MTTLLDMAQERQGPHPFRHEDIITFSLEECLGFDPRIVAELIRELIDRPHELPVEPFPQPVEVLSRLAEDVPIVFVTARDRLEPIQLWLNRALASVPPPLHLGHGHRRPGRQAALPPDPRHRVFRGRPPGNLLRPGEGRHHPPSSSPCPGTASPTPSWKSPAGQTWPASCSKIRGKAAREEVLFPLPPHEMARRTNIQSGIDGRAQKNFWILCIGN